MLLARCYAGGVPWCRGVLVCWCAGELVSRCRGALIRADVLQASIARNINITVVLSVLKRWCHGAGMVLAWC